MKTLYMAVTADEYELPTAVCESVAELAKRYGTSPRIVSSYMSRGITRRKDGVKFLRVEA